MAALAQASLVDLNRAVGGAYPDRLMPINDAKSRDCLFPKLIDGMLETKWMSRGINFNQPIKLKNTNVARAVGIAEDRTWIRADNLNNLTFHHRITDTHWVALDHELIAAGVEKYGQSDFDAQAFVDLKESKIQDAITSKWDLFENQLGAVPDPTTQEGALSATAIEPTSIFTVVNEWTNGLPTTTPSGTAFTTIAGQSPTETGVSPNYTPVQERYTSEAFATFDTPLEAMDRAKRKAQYPRPSTFQQYFENPEWKRCLILAGNVGMNAWEWLNRQGQKNWEKFGEGGVYEPTHHAIPLTYWAKMDTAAIYTNGSSGLVVEGSASAQSRGPRYIGLNANFCHPVVNSARWWYPDEVFRNTPAQPDVWVFRYVTYWNLFFTSRRRHFHVAPAVGSSLFY